MSRSASTIVCAQLARQVRHAEIEEENAVNGFQVELPIHALFSLAFTVQQGIEEVYQQVFVDFLPEDALEAHIGKRVYELCHGLSAFIDFIDAKLMISREIQRDYYGILFFPRQKSFRFLCSSTYFQQKSKFFLRIQILSPYICCVLTVVRTDILVKSVLKILSLIGISTISCTRIISKKTLTSLLYTCLVGSLYTDWRGLLFITCAGLSRASIR